MAGFIPSSVLFAERCFIKIQRTAADRTNATMPFSKDETDTIALIRVMATIGVLVVHLNQRVALPGLFGQIASCGADGVKVYFLLIGYLVMHSWQNRSSTKDCRHKRLSRTLPLYYAWLIVLIIFRFEWITANPLAVPRAVCMLEYVVPSTAAYEYCAMDFLGYDHDFHDVLSDHSLGCKVGQISQRRICLFLAHYGICNSVALSVWVLSTAALPLRASLISCLGI